MYFIKNNFIFSGILPLNLFNLQIIFREFDVNFKKIYLHK